MRKTFLLLLCLMVAMTSRADFEALGGKVGQPYDYIPEASTGLDDVFVFCGMDASTLQFVTDNPSACHWYQYVSASSQAIPVESYTTETASVLTKVEGGRGYIVESGGLQKACYVIDYTATPFSYSEIVPQETAEDICESLQVAVHGEMDDFVFYTPAGKKLTLERLHTLTYTDVEWNSEAQDYVEVENSIEAEGYVSAFIVDAPLQDTEFMLSGDQFAKWFGIDQQSVIAIYSAVHVEQHALAESDSEEEGVISGTTIKGQAPLNVTFSAMASPATDFTTWYLYVDPEDKQKYLYRTEETVDYTFETSGTFQVKMVASNNVCSDSVIFSVTITESSLECPNFFSPRSTPGENDLFRVAYKSIIKFHGRIMNRWGVTLFEWDDPEEGWDGTYNGKPVNPGVYFYLISATGSDGEEYALKGDINLLE